jgi:3-hydroxyisobutyrate dehydrogenase-like beta-hydroxyacid dehydrogenase
MKFVANLLVAIHNVSAAEAFVLGMKAGLPAKTIFEVIENSAGTSRMFQVRGPQMVKGATTVAGIAVELLQKDMRSSASSRAARRADAAVQRFRAIYNAAMAQGIAGTTPRRSCACSSRWRKLRR